MATLRRVGSSIWAPHPENRPQNEAYESEADETLYGGSGGGGKSDLILGTGLTQHRKAIVYRRQQKDAKGLIDRAAEILGDYGAWSPSTHSFKTRDGRELEFGHAVVQRDLEAQQGRARDFVGFDELAQFPLAYYLWLIGWNRSSNPNQRCRVLAASNPPMTAEGHWIVERWGPWLDPLHPRPAEPGELRWFAMIDGKDTEVEGSRPFVIVDGERVHDFDPAAHRSTDIIEPRSRTFIPARLADNPYYRNSGYKAVLQSLPEPLRSALLNGDFTAAMEDDPWQVIPTAWIEAAQARWTDKAPGEMDTVGVDPAMGGRDRLTLAPRHGNWFAPLIAVPGVDVPTGVAAASHVVRHIRDGAVAQVDVIGIGAACYEHLQGMGVACAGMDARHSTDATDRSGALKFTNKRAEWWWGMREALDPETGDNLALPPDSELKADLAAPKWEATVRGIKVEAKEDIAERLGRSTDKGDAAVMALPQAVAKDRAMRRANLPKRANSGYNPHAWRR